MCLMCLEIAKDRMTVKEGRRALRELLAIEQKPELLKHYQELDQASDEELKKIAAKSVNK